MGRQEDGLMKRIIVTGASGFVAGSVICQAGPEWEVHAFSQKPAPFQREGLIWHQHGPLAELLQPGELERRFREIQPDAVIHIAAIPDIDYCEQHPDVADEVNVNYTIALAEMCRQQKVRMVFTSTDTVFDGNKGHYAETDPPAPVNHYGHTKLRAERAVADRLEDFCIARLAIVMGLRFYGQGNSFLCRLRDTLESGREASVPAEEIRSPVDVVTAGRALLELAGNTFQGIIHLAGNDRLSRLDFSRMIAGRLGYPPERVVAATAADIPGRARRPRDASLDNSTARSALKTPMRGLLDGLELVLSTERMKDER
jgi:dTDP-4-dehydrorhamnose reductase